MKILFVKKISSTQEFLLANPRENLCIATQNQTNGIGARGTAWEKAKSGLYFSFMVARQLLPEDVPTQSLGIFFAWHFAEILRNFGHEVIVKWPNDIFLRGQKIAGVLINLREKAVICGIGVNFFSKNFGALQKKENPAKILQKFFKNTGISGSSGEKTSWRTVFRRYKTEFYAHKNFTFHADEGKISLKNAQILNDGSITINGKIFYARTGGENLRNLKHLNLPHRSKNG